MLKLAELQNPLTGLNFQGTGERRALGCGPAAHRRAPAGKIIGLDRRFALEMIQAGDVLVEYDKIIDRQLERAATISIFWLWQDLCDAAKVPEI